MKRPHNNVSVTSAKKMEGKQVPAQRINGPAMEIYTVFVTDKSFGAKMKAEEEVITNQLLRQDIGVDFHKRAGRITQIDVYSINAEKAMKV